MKKISVFLIVVIVILGLGYLFAGKDSKPAKKEDAQTPAYKVRLTIPSGRQNQISTVLAVEKGFFRKNNLDVEVVRAEKNTAAILISGKADAAVANPTSYLAAAAQGAPLLWVANLTNNNHNVFISNKDAKDIKVAGMQNSSMNRITMVSRLKSLNIDPKTVTLEDLGSEDAMLMAFKTKRVDVINLPKMTWLLFAKKNNLTSNDYKILIDDNKDYNNPTFSGLIVQAKLLNEHQDVVENLGKSLVEAVNWMQNNKDEAAAIFGKFAEMPTEDAAIYIDGSIDDTKNLEFTPTKERGEGIINFLAADNPDIKNFKLENYMSLTVADSLKKSGFFEQYNLK